MTVNYPCKTQVGELGIRQSLKMTEKLQCNMTIV